MNKEAKALVAVALLEHAVGLLSAASREATELDLGPRISHINRQILALQGELDSVSRGKLDRVFQKCD